MKRNGKRSTETQAENKRGESINTNEKYAQKVETQTEEINGNTKEDQQKIEIQTKKRSHRLFCSPATSVPQLLGHNFKKKEKPQLKLRLR